VIGLQKSDKEGVALPANWEPGKDVIVPPPGTCGAIRKRKEEVKEKGYKMMDWFLTFREDKDA
jgi:peroxiredoxin (alkyl hydroperoxide reductase subunit C)